MKKLLATLLASTMALSAMGALVACGGDDEDAVTPVKATGFTLTNVYGQAVDSVTLAPDGTVGVLAKLQPANANSTVKWTTSDGKLVTVGGGGLYNSQALITGVDSGSATITAEVEGKKITLPVTVTAWTRFFFVGSGVSNADWTTQPAWEADKLFAEDDLDWMFTQDKTDKHLWTAEVSLTAGAEFKIVPAVYTEDGFKGQSWGASIGVDLDNPDEWSDEEMKKPESERRELKKTSLEGKTGTLNLKSDGKNIAIAENDEGEVVGGVYKFTLKTRAGGGFESLSYERTGDLAE